MCLDFQFDSSNLNRIWVKALELFRSRQHTVCGGYLDTDKEQKGTYSFLTQVIHLSFVFSLPPTPEDKFTIMSRTFKFSSDHARQLGSMTHIEGGVHAMPPKLVADLEAHIANGGSDDFCMRRWHDDQTLSKHGSRRAMYRSHDRSTPGSLLATRYAYENDRQIIVVRIPAGKDSSKAYAAIIIPIENTKALQAYGGSDWHAYPWQVWVPIHTRNKAYGNRFSRWKVVRVLENKRGVERSSVRTPLRRQETSSSTTTNTTSDSWQRTSTTSTLVDDSDEYEAGFEQALMLPKEDTEEMETTSSNRGTNLTSKSIQILKRRGNEEHEIFQTQYGLGKAVELVEKQEPVKPDDFLKFVFRNEKDIIKGEAYISKCTSAEELFDFAFEAEIVDLNTRMLSITIGNLKTTPMKVRREESFIKLVQQAKDVSAGGQVVVVVKKCY